MFSAMAKSAFVFPGQGSQFVGMGLDLFDSDKETKAIYELANEIFENECKSSMGDFGTKLISEVSFRGPEDLLTQTLYTQPAILTLSVAIANKVKQAIQAGNITKPSYVAGHSLGEFSALYMADVLSLEDLIKLVTIRARLMNEAPSGAMTAIVGLDEITVNDLVSQVTDAGVANYNAPDQIVATGSKVAMSELGSLIEAYARDNNLRVKVIPLSVGGAFHSALMAEAAKKFDEAIESCDFRNASIPVVQNFRGMPVSERAELKNNLRRQMTGSVQWTETLRFMMDKEQGGVDEIWELGPGKVLAGLVKKQDRRFPTKNISTLGDLVAITTGLTAGQSS
jgi:[acyl-carrier-protein] S-malonyltransferase